MQRKECSKKMLQKGMFLWSIYLFLSVWMALPVRAEEGEKLAPDLQGASATLKKDSWGDEFVYLTWSDANQLENAELYEYEIQISCNQDWASIEEQEVRDSVRTYYSETPSLSYGWISHGNQYYFRARSVYCLDETDEKIYSNWLEFEMLPYYYEAPEDISVRSAGVSKLILNWNPVNGAEGYRIYRSDSEEGAYTLLKTITDAYADTYTDSKNVKTGTTYYYKICTYNADFSYTDGFLSLAYSGAGLPLKRTLTAKTASYSSILLKWNADSTVRGYQIYRSDSRSGRYQRIKTIASSDITSYQNTNCMIGKTYYYKIRSYVVVDGKTYYSPCSSIVKEAAAVLAPTLQSIKIADVTKATLTWKKVSGAHGYVIYRSNSKAGAYERIGAAKGNSQVSYTAKGLENGKTYYFKIKAYRKVGGKNYYGAFSSVKSRLMNRLAYEGEYYESRCKRIFKTDYYKDFRSASQAAKQMKTISVKVWDFNSSGKKYTKTLRVTVHKNIAPTVQQIFQEIYKGKEKFPIHSLGGYSWRGNSSSSEHCEGLAIDINANENAMIDKRTGKILAGSFYKPGKNPYSIPANGDVVKAFEKYGFYWGDWSTKVDYMHFSYFGT